MRDSVDVALTWVRSHVDRFAALGAKFDDATDVHVHLAESRRVEGRPVRRGHPCRRSRLGADRTAGAGRCGHDRGSCRSRGWSSRLPASGEKVLAACRASMAAMVLPAANEAEIADSFGNELPCGIRVRYARTMDDVLEVALPDIVAYRTDPAA